MDKAWAISLTAIGISTIILAGAGIAGIELDQAVTRILGVIDLIALPVFAFSTVKKIARRTGDR